MRSWIVIPVMGSIVAAGATGLGAAPWAIGAAALAGAALAAAIRALAGDTPAAIVAAAIAPLLAVASIADQHGIVVLPCVAIAAAAWTIAELARPTTLLVALLPATGAAVLEPATAGLLLVAAIRIVIASRQRAAWIAPLGGVAVVALAIATGLGAFPSLAQLWFARPPAPVDGSQLAHLVAASLGPIAAVAALAGLAIALRPRYGEIALVAWVAGALLVDLRAGAIGPATFGPAALCAGLAIGRLAGLIRISSGQAFAGATAGALLLLPPAWAAIEHGPRVALAAVSG